VLGAVGLAGCSSGGSSGSDDPETDEPTETTTPDVPILNYALTLEHLENAFYRDGLATFGEDELTEADALSEFGERLRQSVPDRLAAVGEREAAHVEALTATVEEGEENLGYETPSELLGVGKALENTGVAAYAGAAATVANDDVFSAAIGIHSVEARRASFLNELNGTASEIDDVGTRGLLRNPAGPSARPASRVPATAAGGPRRPTRSFGRWSLPAPGGISRRQPLAVSRERGLFAPP
jgi:hypothetical protein